jgi:hypothetical protein
LRGLLWLSSTCRDALHRGLLFEPAMHAGKTCGNCRRIYELSFDQATSSRLRGEWRS